MVACPVYSSVQKILKICIQHRINKHSDFRWVTINTSCFATLKMSNGFNRFYERRRFVKLQLVCQMRNSKDHSVLPIAPRPVEAQTVRMSASQGEEPWKRIFYQSALRKRVQNWWACSCITFNETQRPSLTQTLEHSWVLNARYFHQLFSISLNSRRRTTISRRKVALITR